MRNGINKKVIAVGISLLLLGSMVMAGYVEGSIDPSRIGVGAKVLGMGQTGVAIEGANLLVNPAGIVNGENAVKLNSIYTSLLDGDISYLAVGGSMPTPYGLWGITYLLGSASNIGLYNNDRVSQGTSDYSNNTIILTTGAKLSDLKCLNWLKLPVSKAKLSVGLNVKLFYQSASKVDGFSANGQDLDFGMMYKYDNKLNLGLSLQNFLPQSLGGNLHWVNNKEEGIPMNTKLGVGYRYNDNILLAGDVDVRQDMTPIHLGGEYLFNKYLTLRAGLDQSVQPGKQLANDFTAGLGLNYQGFKVNYAYHPYSMESRNTYHYFEVSYVGAEQAKKTIAPEVEEAPEEATSELTNETISSVIEPSGLAQTDQKVIYPGSRTDIHIIQPADKIKVYDDAVNVRLLVKSDIDNLEINGSKVSAVRGGIVGARANLSYGKQSILITYDKEGNAYREERTLLRLPRFTDVPEGRWSKDIIEYLSAMGLYWGTSMPTEFNPKAEVTVRDLAEIVAKLNQIKTGSTVDTDQAMYDIISLAKKLGYPELLKPNAIVNRALSCAVVTELANIPVMKVAKSPFVDVVPGKWFTDRVMAAKNAGLISGAKVKGRDYFFPGDATTREGLLTLLRPLLNKEVSAIKP